MAILDRFACPAHLTDLSDDDRQSWSDFLSTSYFEPFLETCPQFYDPTKTDTPDTHATHVVCWNAFPATLHQTFRSNEARWKAADERRTRQDEYCEWAVTRNDDGSIRAITFTTETPDYYEHLFSTDQDLLVALYGEFTDGPVEVSDLTKPNGVYDPTNVLNFSTPGQIVHLGQETNTLGAAVTLAAEATILRHDSKGQPVTNQQQLVTCSQLGEKLRNSDPQIGSAVNNLVANGSEITLADPAGLYIADLLTAGVKTKDGTDPREFWTIERGTPEFALRARFEVPEALDYTVSDIRIDGRPITFGAQLAERVQIKVAVVSKPGDFEIERQPCLG